MRSAVVVVGDIRVGAGELHCRSRKDDGLLHNGDAFLILATSGLEDIDRMNCSRISEMEYQVQT